MRKSVLRMLAAAGLIALPVMTAEAAGGRDDLRKVLYERFQPSKIEFQDPARRGAVVRKGRLLMLSAEGVPARPFRVIQANHTSPAYHVMDFARVEIGRDGRVEAEPAPFTLTKGTRMVVLDVKVEGDRIHVLTHTADRLPATRAGEGAYGCTEFVFRFDPSDVGRSGVDPVLQLIERWLGWTPAERVCSPGVDQLCLEP